jgi:uncharacterized membrane protein YkoI
MNTKLIAGGILAGMLATAGTAGVVAAQSATEAPGLSTEQAIQIALAEVPGDVQETELEREDGMQVYEIEILTADGVEMEVEIDAQTGAVLEIEVEDDLDDDSDDDDDEDDDA